MEIDRDSTEYIYIGVTGEVPDTSAEVAFIAPAARPAADDWESATIVDDVSDPLWPDAVASGAAGDYFIARLVGPFGGNTVVLAAGDYQCWVRLTDTTERPIRIAPNAVEVL